MRLATDEEVVKCFQEAQDWLRHCADHMARVNIEEAVRIISEGEDVDAIRHATAGLDHVYAALVTSVVQESQPLQIGFLNYLEKTPLGVWMELVMEPAIAKTFTGDESDPWGYKALGIDCE